MDLRTLMQAGLAGGENAILAKRPYIANSGRYAGQAVVAFNTGSVDGKGNPVYGERPIQINASTLRKDEWVSLEDAIIEAARERLVIVDDLISGGLTYNVGGLGTLVSEWENASEMTDASISMDGETDNSNGDRQQFSLSGVPIPVIEKKLSIGERVLLASRQRGAALDVTQGTEAARAIARTSEALVFYGSNVSARDTSGNQFTIPGLTTFAQRATQALSDWANAGVSNETILTEILTMIKKLETEERKYGPYTLYIPGAWAFRFRQDFKANSDKTLMQRVMEIEVIKAVRISDTLQAGDVILIELERGTIDLAIASDITTVQWQSGSGWTNHFQAFAAWAPRLKADYDGHCGICHGSTP